PAHLAGFVVSGPPFEAAFWCPEMLLKTEIGKVEPRDEGLRVYSFKELTETPEFHFYANDPVGHALRDGVKRCGERLWEITHDTDKMRDTLYRVAGESYRRIDIMDKWWDGVGGDWWA